MFHIKEFEKDDIGRVIAFERELREQEPDTYYWEPDMAYRKQLEQSFDDERFRTALSFIAVKEEKVIGRIDASLISSRSTARSASKSEKRSIVTAIKKTIRIAGSGARIPAAASPAGITFRETGLTISRVWRDQHVYGQRI